jgi:hypothetical protein
VNVEDHGRVRFHLNSVSTPRTEAVGHDDRVAELDELQRLNDHALKDI